MNVKELPYADRPREKAIKYGISKINNSELLAILLRSGTLGKSAIDVGYEVLNKFNGLSGLINVSLIELCSIKGIDKVKAIQLLAAIELSKRINDNMEEKKKIIDPLDVYNLVGDTLKNEPQEHFVIILLDIKSNLIHFHKNHYIDQLQFV